VIKTKIKFNDGLKINREMDHFVPNVMFQKVEVSPDGTSRRLVWTETKFVVQLDDVYYYKEK